MIFYSLDDLGGQMPTFPNTVESTTENPDGSFVWVVPPPGINTYDGSSAPVGATPLPATFPLFATGLGALGLLGWRRKRNAQAVA